MAVVQLWCSHKKYPAIAIYFEKQDMDIDREAEMERKKIGKAAMESTIAAAAAAALPLNRALRIADSMEKKHENKNGRTLSKEEEEKKRAAFVSVCRLKQSVCSVQRAHQTETGGRFIPSSSSSNQKPLAFCLFRRLCRAVCLILCLVCLVCVCNCQCRLLYSNCSSSSRR